MIRLTNASDTGGVDALWWCGYSYWRNINNHVGQDELLVFLGVDRQRGGDGPSLWRVDKRTDAVTPVGPIFPPSHPLSWATAEGWFWSALHPTLLYATDLTHLYTVDVEPVLRGQTPIVQTLVDVTHYRPDKIAAQWHASHDETRFSATIKDATTYAPEGSAVYLVGDANPWRTYPKRGDYDECQIDKSGAWLLTKDNIDAEAGEDNLIYQLDSTMAPRVLYDQQGAAGHSDNGYGYMVAADNWNAKASAFRVWMFDDDRDPQGRLCYYTPTWDAELNHLSHCNARDAAPDAQYVIGSGANRTQAPRNNEVIAFRLDDSHDVLVIAPTLVDLKASGGGTDDYAKLPKGNSDVAGEWFLWTSNHGSDRLDAFLVRVPSHLLVPITPPRVPMWTVIDPSGATRRFIEVQ